MHELYEELDAFDPRWRMRYATIYLAFLAAELPYEIWNDFILSGAYSAHHAAVAVHGAVVYPAGEKLIPGAVVSEPAEDGPEDLDYER